MASGTASFRASEQQSWAQQANTPLTTRQLRHTQQAQWQSAALPLLWGMGRLSFHLAGTIHRDSERSGKLMG